MLNVKKIK